MVKLQNNRGAVNRLVAVLAVLVLIMLVVVLLPSFQWMKDQAELHACEAGLDTAWRKMAEDTLPVIWVV